MGKTTSTHFAKPKLKQKHNSLYAKSSKVPKYIIIESKTQKKKRPLDLPQE
jgi:hypothetical protein